MDVFSIRYAPQGWSYKFSLIISVYSAAFGLGLLIYELMLKNYGLVFYCSLILILLAVILLLILTLGQPKPLVYITSEVLSANVSGHPLSLNWTDIKDINAGISSLKVETQAGKIYEIELKSLVYEDLKNLKSRLLELCENKGIPFRNDY